MEDVTIFQYELLMALRVVTDPEYQENVQESNKAQEWERKVAAAAEKSRKNLEEATEKISNINFKKAEGITNATK